MSGFATKPYDFSRSNLIMMTGSQLLLVFIIIIVVYFGVDPSTFPAEAMRQLLESQKSTASTQKSTASTASTQNSKKT